MTSSDSARILSPVRVLLMSRSSRIEQTIAVTTRSTSLLLTRSAEKVEDPLGLEDGRELSPLVPEQEALLEQVVAKKKSPMALIR